MKRGEVWWADLPPPAGRRPVVLLSRDEAYSFRSMIIISPVTTRVRHIPSEVKLGPEDGLPRRCVVNVDTINTIPIFVLKERVSRLSEEKLAAVDEALHFALGMKG